jgi:hypothetical protein
MTTTRALSTFSRMGKGTRVFAIGAGVAATCCTLGWLLDGSSSLPADKGPKATSSGRPSSPLVGAATPEDAERDFEGVARTRIEAGSYLYFEIETASQSRRWVATLKTSDAAVGSHVRVSTYAMREGFESRRLGRRFEQLWFGRVKPIDRALDRP